MSGNCGVCDKLCDDDNSVKCVGGCHSAFHLSCLPSTGSSDALKTRSAKKDWQCESCKPTRDRLSSVSSKSVSATSMTKEFFIKTFEAFKADVFAELKKNSKEFNDVRESLKFVSDSLDTNNKLIEELKNGFKGLKKENQELQEENMKLKRSVAALETRMRNMEQYSRQSNVEISGVPESTNENKEELLEDVASAMNIKLNKERVVAAHRVPSYNKKRTAPIVVKFTTRNERDIWLAGFKSMRPMTADKINKNFRRDQVFINEHLSPENKLLLSKTKEVAKSKGYKYVWSREGKIFIRRENGETCKRIDSDQDLCKL